MKDKKDFKLIPEPTEDNKGLEEFMDWSDVQHAIAVLNKHEGALYSDTIIWHRGGFLWKLTANEKL